MEYRKRWRNVLLALALTVGFVSAPVTELLAQEESGTQTENQTESREQAESEVQENVLSMLENVSNGVDIVAVLDGSRSIRPWKTQRDAAARTLISLQGGTDSTMGVVFFSGGFLSEDSPAYTMGEDSLSESELKDAAAYAAKDSYQNISLCSPLFSLNKVADRQSLLETLDGLSAAMDEQVESIPLEEVSTNLATGITSALNMLDMGTNDKKVILLFSDGINDTRNDIDCVEKVYDAQTRQAAALAQQAGVEIHVVYLIDDETTDAQKAALSEQALLQLVNYYQEGDTYNDRYQSLYTSDLSGLEESFFSVLHENTDIEYREKSVNDSGIYTLSDLPQSGAQNVSIVFRGTDVQITDVIKNGEYQLTDGILYNYGQGEDSVSAVFLGSVRAEDSWQIITNSAEERCYEVYNNTLQVGMTADGDRLRVTLYDLEGEAVAPEKGMSIDIDYIDTASQERTTVVQNLKSNGTEFVTEELDVNRETEHTYRILLKDAEGTAIGSCTWEGEIREAEPGPELKQKAAAKVWMSPVSLGGSFWHPQEPYGSFSAETLIDNAPEDWSEIKLKITHLEEQTLTWSLDQSTGRLLVADQDFLTENWYYPVIISKIQVELQTADGLVQSAVVVLQEWNVLFFMGLAAVLILGVILIGLRRKGKSRDWSRLLKRLSDQELRFGMQQETCRSLQNQGSDLEQSWIRIEERLEKLVPGKRVKELMEEYPRLKNEWDKFEAWRKENKPASYSDCRKELGKQLGDTKELIQKRKKHGKGKKLLDGNAALLAELDKLLEEQKNYLASLGEKLGQIRQRLEEVEAEFIPFSCSLLMEKDGQMLALSCVKRDYDRPENDLGRRRGPQPLSSCRRFGDAAEVQLPKTMKDCQVLGDRRGIQLLNREYVKIVKEGKNCEWTQSPRGANWKLLRLQPGSYTVDDTWALHVLDPKNGEV